ncbi:MAG: hypothetical protein QXF25_02415, partial [Candidatus Pacearchaeota archaeon]
KTGSGIDYLYPRIKLDQNGLLHFLYKGENDQFWYTNSNDEGNTWLEPTKLSDLPSYLRFRNRLELDGNLPVVVWNEGNDTLGYYEGCNILFTKFNGSNWTIPQDISNTQLPMKAAFPSLIITQKDGDSYYNFIWLEGNCESVNYNIHYKRIRKQ